MTLCPIPTIKMLAALEMSKDHGDKPELRWIETPALLIDRTYQRDILEKGAANIRRIVTSFRWSRFGALLVADRGDGRFAVIDGQHRTVAAVLLSIPKVPCLVITCSIEEEARSFAAVNGGVTQLHGLQIYRARLAAKAPEAVALQKLCDDCGIIILANPGLVSKVGETMAIGSLLLARERHGDEVLGAALKAIVHCGDAAIGKIGPAVICGLTDVLGTHPAWVKSQWSLDIAVKGAGIGAVLKSAARIRALDGGSTRAIFAKQMEKLLRQALV